MLDTLGSLRRALSNSDEVILYIEDWTAFVRDSFHGDRKVLKSWYDLFLKALALFAPELFAADSSGKVRVLFQSEGILQDPNNYWISVIDVGRAFVLDDVRAFHEGEEVSVYEAPFTGASLCIKGVSGGL